MKEVMCKEKFQIEKQRGTPRIANVRSREPGGWENYYSACGPRHFNHLVKCRGKGWLIYLCHVGFIHTFCLNSQISYRMWACLILRVCIAVTTDFTIMGLSMVYRSMLLDLNTSPWGRCCTHSMLYKKILWTMTPSFVFIHFKCIGRWTHNRPIATPYVCVTVQRLPNADT